MANMYDIDPHIAEIYDQSETYREDVDLLLALIAPLLLEAQARTPPLEKSGYLGPSGIVGAGSEPAPTPHTQISEFSILEPFCGTGRILIPLAQAGHTLVGLDQAGGMLERARQKLSLLPVEVQNFVSLHLADVITAEWPAGFDLVILGGNCLYELATPEQQEHVIRSAAVSLKSGGHVYVDNNHMEGDLDPSWQQPGVRPGFPSGVCADGTRVESTTETIWFDIPARLVKFRRTTRVNLPGSPETSGKAEHVEYIQQKHPVSAVEVQTWLEKYGFIVEKVFGDRNGSPYTPASNRAIFWARSGVITVYGTPY